VAFLKKSEISLPVGLRNLLATLIIYHMIETGKSKKSNGGTGEDTMKTYRCFTSVPVHVSYEEMPQYGYGDYPKTEDRYLNIYGSFSIPVKEADNHLRFIATVEADTERKAQNAFRKLTNHRLCFNLNSLSADRLEVVTQS